MANLRFITPNRLRAKAARERRRLLLFGVPVAFILFLLHPVLGLWCGGLLLVLGSSGSLLLHGAEGEERALGHPVPCPGSLRELPDHYLLFNNLDVPSGAGRRELDVVVLGRNGLFLVEVKHLRGAITGDESDPHWVQRKLARQSGSAYENPVRNPVAQVRSAAGVLHRYLASRGIDIWVQGIVVFTHPAAVLQVRSDTVPVVRLPDLARTIAAQPVNRPPRQFLEILETLKALRAGTFPESKPGLQHVSVFMRDFVTREERLRRLIVEPPNPLQRAALRLKKPLTRALRPLRHPLDLGPPITPASREPARSNPDTSEDITVVRHTSYYRRRRRSRS